MYSFPNLPRTRNTLSSSYFGWHNAAPSYHQVNRVFGRNLSAEQQPLQQAKCDYKSQDNRTTNHFRPLIAPDQEEPKANSHIASSSGVHVFSLPIRRIRGFSAALNKLNMCEYIIETVGRIIEDRDQEESSSSNPCGVIFHLEEQVERARGVQIKCSFVDIDETQPEVYYNRIYRCVGRYAVHHGVFQCYSITLCDDNDLQLQEIFQIYSDNVITQMLSRK
ncbi:hypothetical protein Aperf_G00000076629 [Anoplocephala perfoliata]